MGRAQSKVDLLTAAKENYEKLWQLIDELSEKELATDFDFSDDIKKKEAHWNRDNNLRDVLIHLYEWHHLLLDWINENRAGKEHSFLPAPYNWKTYGQMNVGFFEKHQNTSLEDAKTMLKESHREVMELIETLSNEELFTKGVFKWSVTTTVGSYCVSATASHYDWAMKKIRAHKKKLK